MASITNGTYYIQNVAFPQSVINLSGGLPYGTINGWPHEVSTNLQWIVNNLGNNQITLENATARGYYLTVDYFFKAAPAFGSPNSTYWTVTEVTPGVYSLAANGFLLSLSEGGIAASIYITPQTASGPGTTEQWEFDGAGQ